MVMLETVDLDSKPRHFNELLMSNDDMPLELSWLCYLYLPSTQLYIYIFIPRIIPFLPTSVPQKQKVSKAIGHIMFYYSFINAILL